MNEEVRDIMKITGFNNFFDFFDTMDECLKVIKD
jgi:anti-anti-sigma regulatory factor